MCAALLYICARELIAVSLGNKATKPPAERSALECLCCRFYMQWAGDLLKTVNGAEFTLPVGRFVTDSNAAEALQHSGLQIPSVTFLMQNCDLRWLDLLEIFLWRASGSDAASVAWTPFLSQHGRGPIHRCNAPSYPPLLRLTCPSGFRSLQEVNLLHSRRPGHMSTQAVQTMC